MAAQKRLKKELGKLMKAEAEEYSVEPDASNMMVWNATILGPEGTPYAGGVFNLTLTFPANYPFKAPEVTFVTKVYHPSITKEKGEICHDMLKDWAPTHNVEFVLKSLRQLLADFDAVETPLEADIANQVKTDPKAFAKECKKWVKKYAA